MSSLPPIAAWLLDCLSAIAVVGLTGTAFAKLSEWTQNKVAVGLGTLAAFAILMVGYSEIHYGALGSECRGSIPYYDCTHPEPPATD